MELTARLTPSWFDLDGAGFLLAPLTGAQFINVQQAGSKMLGDGMALAVEYAVRDWRGITDNGVEVKFTRAARDQLFSDENLLLAIGAEICDRARLSREQAKKS